VRAAAVALAVGLWVIGVVAADDSIYIAFVREDGYLVPTLVVEGDDYFPFESPFLEHVTPVPGVWQFWKRGATTATEIRAIKQATRGNHCEEEPAWRSTIKGISRPPYISTAGKIGVAIRGVRLEPLAEVRAQEDADSRRVARLIIALARREEAARLGAEPDNPLHQYDAATRASAPIIIDTLLRDSAEPAVYYFEAFTKYAKHHPRTSGWVIDTGGRLETSDIQFRMDFGYLEVARTYFLGVVPYHQKRLWLGVWSGYEGERYGLYDWPARLRYFGSGGGGC
jgi:hypothetical protein